MLLEISGKYIIFEIPNGVQSSAFSYSHLKEPFRIPSAPALVLRDMVAQGDNSKTVELKIDMTFTADDLERYDALNRTPAPDIRFLLACHEAHEMGCVR